jgi:hypothetical protein
MRSKDARRGRGKEGRVDARMGTRTGPPLTSGGGPSDFSLKGLRLGPGIGFAPTKEIQHQIWFR